MVVNFVVFAAIARHLGPNDFGILSYCLSLLFFLTPLWNLGTDHVFKQKFSVNQIENSPTLISTFTTLRIITSVVILFLVVGFAHFFLSQINYFLLIIISTSLVFRSLESVEVFNNSQLMSKNNTFSKTISFLIISIINLIGIYYSAPLIFFALTYSLEFVFYALFQLYFFKKYKLKLQFQLDKEKAIQIIKKSFPIFASTCFSVIFFKVDQIILGNMLGMEAVGQYAAAVRLSEIWYFIPASIMISLFAPIQSYFINDKTKYLQLLRNTYTGLFLFSLILCLFITLTSEIWVNLLYKNAFAQTSQILTIHIWSLIFVAWGFAQEPWDVANNFLKHRFIRLATGAVLSVVLCYLLIPSFGIIGAAYSALISRAVAYFFINLFFKESREVFYIQISSVTHIYAFLLDSFQQIKTNLFPKKKKIFSA